MNQKFQIEVNYKLYDFKLTLDGRLYIVPFAECSSCGAMIRNDERNMLQKHTDFHARVGL